MCRRRKLTIFTTLEPCTSRGHPKLPCVERLIERRLGRVVIGTVDPNPDVQGLGILRLRAAGIAVSFFDETAMAEVEELNREFFRAMRATAPFRRALDPRHMERLAAQRLDDWYRTLNRIYWSRNFDRTSAAVFSHLVEVVGGVSLLASSKSKPDVDPKAFIAKAVAWWLALAGKVGVRSVEDLLWDKFPGVCPYCHEVPHDPSECSHRKASANGPDWPGLATIGQARERPSSVAEWQQLFAKIYPVQQTEEFGPSFGRLAEELGELAEALRVFSAQPGYFLSEAADVFAWLMHIANIVDFKDGVRREAIGVRLSASMCRLYPDACKDCGRSVCACPPILQNTIGRIAHEVPPERGGATATGRFMNPDAARRLFSPPGPNETVSDPSS